VTRLLRLALPITGLLLAACAPAVAGSPLPSHAATAGPVSTVFVSAPAAALAGAEQLARARHLAIFAGGACPAQMSCLSFRDEFDGQDAAYFRYAVALSDGDGYACLVYVYGGEPGWRLLNTDCGLVPERGSTQAVSAPRACAAVQDQPGAAGRTLGCLKDGTAVDIDGGPIYVASSSIPAAAVWWHLRGQGWMAHAFLSPGLTDQAG
jgi:hypothetical protein